MSNIIHSNGHEEHEINLFWREIEDNNRPVGINGGLAFVHAFEDFLNDFEKKENIFIKKLIEEQKGNYDEKINYKNYLIALFQYGIKNIEHDWAPETIKYFSNLPNIHNKEAILKEINSNKNLKIFLEECMKEINVNFFKELNGGNYTKVNYVNYCDNEEVQKKIDEISKRLLNNLHYWPQDTFLFILDNIENNNTSYRKKIFEDELN